MQKELYLWAYCIGLWARYTQSFSELRVLYKHIQGALTAVLVMRSASGMFTNEYWPFYALMRNKIAVPIAYWGH